MEVDANRKIVRVRTKLWTHFCYRDDLHIEGAVIRYKTFDDVEYISPSQDTYVSEVNWEKVCSDRKKREEEEEKSKQIVAECKKNTKERYDAQLKKYLDTPWYLKWCTYDPRYASWD